VPISKYRHPGQLVGKVWPCRAVYVPLVPVLVAVGWLRV
jgi:hypothetical protein